MLLEGNPEKRFSDLLTEAIQAIKKQTGQNMRPIEKEIGEKLGFKSGAMIEHWRKPDSKPPNNMRIELLAIEIQKRTGLDRNWFKAFLEKGAYPHPDTLLDQLFPIAQPGPTSSGIPPGSRLVHARNPYFIGRERDMAQLVNLLVPTSTAGETAAGGETKPPVVILTGLGGMGKTQLASEFVHRYGQHFPGGVYWLRFEDPDGIPAEVATCGSLMNLSPIYYALSEEDRVHKVRDAWHAPISRLLIFDNCENQQLLHHWLPKTGGCRVLVTARRGEWDPSFGAAIYPLDVLYRYESQTLLHKISGYEEEMAHIFDQIAAELGDLPLALHLAGTYLHTTRRFFPPAAYLAQLRATNPLQHPSLTGAELSPTDHEMHVLKSFSISYNQLNLENPTDKVGHELLVRAAFFAPGEPIWYNLLVKTLEEAFEIDPTDHWKFAAGKRWETSNEVEPDSLEELQLATRANAGLDRLIALGLIEGDPIHVNILRMHRLISHFVRQMAPLEMADALKKVESVVLNAVEVSNRSGAPLPLLNWNSQLRSVVEEALTRNEPRSAILAHVYGDHLALMGEYQNANPYFERALEIWDSNQETESAEIAAILHSIGNSLRVLNRLDEAKPHLDKALAQRIALFGESGLVTAGSYNALGRWWGDGIGDFAKAKDLYQKSVSLARDHLGNNHEITAEYLNNLGICLSNMGDHQEAFPYVHQALETRRMLLGEDHPLTALSYNNVGHVLFQSKEGTYLRDAPYYFEQSLFIRENILGREHPVVAESLINLGSCRKELREHDQAIIHFQRSISILAKAYGQEDSRIGVPFGHLAVCYGDLGENELAVDAFEQALAIFKQDPSKNENAIQFIEQNLDELST